MALSKSLYTRAIQCPKSLWLKKYNSSVLTPPDATAKAVFETGNEVGELACGLFPHGKEGEFTRDYDEMMATTAQYIDEGVENIYEATFNYDGILVMVDVLRVDTDGVDIYLYDVSIQYYEIWLPHHTSFLFIILYTVTWLSSNILAIIC